MPDPADVDELFLDAFIAEGLRPETVRRLARSVRLPRTVVRGWVRSARHRRLLSRRAWVLVLTDAGRQAAAERENEHRGVGVSLGPSEQDPVFLEWSGPQHRN